MKKTNLLLVEDNEDISAIVSWMLENEGYSVTTTHHLPARELAALAPGLIILDEWIADSSGHMLCREIKALAELAHIPVIIFSTASDIQLLVDSCGADGFIRKPFDLEDIAKEVARVLDAFRIDSSEKVFVR